MRRNWLLVAVFAALVVIGGAAILGRTTENDKSIPADTWAEGVCTELGDWKSEIAALTDTSGEPPTPESIEDKLGAARDATEELVDNLRALGPPQTESREEVEQELDQQVSELEQTFDEVEASVQEVADSETDLAAKIAALSGDIKALLEQGSEALAALEEADPVGEVTSALQSEPSCQQLL